MKQILSLAFLVALLVTCIYQPRSFPHSIAQALCVSLQQEFTVTRVYKGYAQQERVEIYNGADTSASATPLLTIQGTASDSDTTKTYSICLTFDHLYTVVLTEKYVVPAPLHS